MNIITVLDAIEDILARIAWPVGSRITLPADVADARLAIARIDQLRKQLLAAGYAPGAPAPMPEMSAASALHVIAAQVAARQRICNHDIPMLRMRGYAATATERETELRVMNDFEATLKVMGIATQPPVQARRAS